MAEPRIAEMASPTLYIQRPTELKTPSLSDPIRNTVCPASIRDVDGASLTFGPAEGLDPMVALLWSSPSAATEHRSVGGALELGGGADRGPVDRWQTWTRERVKRPVRPGRPGRGEGEGLDRAETDCGCDIRIP